MTAPEPIPNAEHIDAVARAITVTTRDGNGRRVVSKDVALTVARAQARALLTSTDPRVHEALVANLPAARNLRHDWPHMIQPGEMQAPGRVKSEGATA